MKKTIVLICLLLVITSGKAQQINSLYDWLREYSPACFAEGTGEVDTVCLASLPLERLTVGDWTSLEGLRYLKRLKYFKLINYHGTDTIELPESLITLDIEECDPITKIKVRGNLDTFLLWGKPPKEWPAFPEKLRYMKVFPWVESGDTLTIYHLPDSLQYYESQNTFLSLSELPPTLQALWVGYIDMLNLPDLPATLTELFLQNVPVSSIQFFPPSLKSINLWYCRFSTLPNLPENLESLVVMDNQELLSLPALPQHLKTLTCTSTPLRHLPILPASLEKIECGDNQLTDLPQLPPGLKIFGCAFNPIECMPVLPNGLQTLYIMECTRLRCMPNIPANCRVQANNQQGPASISWPLPLCNPTNNIFQCQSRPVINGKLFYDLNLNGIHDPNEPLKGNGKVLLSDGKITMSNINGQYSIGTDTLGPYTIEPSEISYFNIVPPNATFTFARYDTMVTSSFALQPNTSIDELATSIHPLLWAARPGFSYPYQISFENAGTVSSSPSLVIDYDELKLDYDSCSNGDVVNNNGTLTLSAANFLPGKKESFIAYFSVKTTAPFGDSLRCTATFSNPNTSANDRTVRVIGGSFDPNDKHGTPVLTPTQVANGEYIDYTIRFQNTGTDTAFTVVISDTLSSDLQVSTLKLISASHSCKATLKNNVVYFEFLNILLPDSNVNEPKSHGFVSFKIKPVSSIAVNSNINNKAAIYFDYNAPVITNTAVTAIRNPLVPLPLKLMAFTATRQTANNAIIQWNTSNEIHTSRFIIQYNTDGSNFINCGTENARSGQYNLYRSEIAVPTETVYLRLKMLDVDGRFTYSPVVVLKKHNGKNGFSILNNPAKNMLTISVQDAGLKNTLARIINAQGSIVQTALLQQDTEQVSLHRLPAGVYILQTSLGSEQFVIIQ